MPTSKPPKSPEDYLETSEEDVGLQMNGESWTSRPLNACRVNSNLAWLHQSRWHIHQPLAAARCPLARLAVHVKLRCHVVGAIYLRRTADAQAAVTSFVPDAWLRDSLTFTWDIRSLHGRERIASYLSEGFASTTVTNARLASDSHLAPKQSVLPFGRSTVEFGFFYETTIAHGKGFTRLVEDADGWRALLVSMITVDLKGFEEPRGAIRLPSCPSSEAWLDAYSQWRTDIETNPTVLIVGGGQNGLQVAARFKQMGISTLLIERNERIGDNWRHRYESLTLHTTKEQHQLLYQPYPENWPKYTPRDKLANWLESYATNQDLPVWTSSTIVGRPVYNEERRRWSVLVNRSGTHVQVQPAHIVMATGVLGEPYIPNFPDRERFTGLVLHSTQYSNAKSFTGKRVVVVGAGNSSIDICQDSVLSGAESVTMIQRSATCVVSIQNVGKRLAQIWPPGVPTEVCDFRVVSTPLGFLREQMIRNQEAQWAEEKELHEKLRKGGLELTLGPEGQGQYLLVQERYGGFWQDKGGADLIASGKIKIKQGVEPTRYSANGLVLSDGSELPADVIILATGYKNMRETLKEIFGPELIEHTSEIHGLDEEGESRGGYRPTGHPALWYAGGDFFHSRFMSKQLGMLIIASEQGLFHRQHPRL